MIARHSEEESRGSGDGVEVVVNEACHDDKHGDGQYTEKRIYLTRYAFVVLIEDVYNHYHMSINLVLCTCAQFVATIKQFLTINSIHNLSIIIMGAILLYE